MLEEILQIINVMNNFCLNKNLVIYMWYIYNMYLH